MKLLTLLIAALSLISVAYCQQDVDLIVNTSLNATGLVTLSLPDDMGDVDIIVRKTGASTTTEFTVGGLKYTEGPPSFITITKTSTLPTPVFKTITGKTTMQEGGYVYLGYGLEVAPVSAPTCAFKS